MTLQHKNNERGFTIVELLIVIIVIGILATLVLIAYNNVQGQARDTKRQANTSSVADAAETYKASSVTGTYPEMTNGLTFQTALNTASNYTNGAKAVSVDTTVTGNTATTGSTATSNKLNVTPASNNKEYISVLYCKDGSTDTDTNPWTTATGLKLGYWSESANTTKYDVTGTGAGTNTSATCS